MDFNKKQIWGYCDVFSAIAIFKAIHDIEYSKIKFNGTNVDWLKSFLETKNYSDNYKNYLELGHVQFNLPPNFWMNNYNSITNGDVVINVEVVSKAAYNNIKSLIDNYVNIIKNDGGKPKYKLFKINNIEVHNIKNLNSHTVRYFFIKNDLIFHLFSFNANDNLDYYVYYLINSIKNKTELLIADLIFNLPPNFHIMDSTSISNDKCVINIFVNINKVKLDELINDQLNQIEETGGTPSHNIFNMANMELHEVTDLTLTSRKFLFEYNNFIYNIEFIQNYDNLNFDLNYLMNSIEKSPVRINNMKMNNNKFVINECSFVLPPDFWINSSNAISDGYNLLQFKHVKNYTKIDVAVKNYENYVKREGGKPIYNKFNVNDIMVHNIKNLNSKTIRYWFKYKNEIYQIFTFLGNEKTDFYIKYLISTLS